MVPDGLRYTKEHEWAAEEGRIVRVGITHFAQDSLGDIVYVDLPPSGTPVTAGQPFGEVESTKSVSDLYAPISGTILEKNTALDDTPELVNQDPYEKGWLVLIQAADAGETASLLTADEYRAFIESQA